MSHQGLLLTPLVKPSLLCSCRRVSTYCRLRCVWHVLNIWICMTAKNDWTHECMPKFHHGKNHPSGGWATCTLNQMFWHPKPAEMLSRVAQLLAFNNSQVVCISVSWVQFWVLSLLNHPQLRRGGLVPPPDSFSVAAQNSKWPAQNSACTWWFR